MRKSWGRDFAIYTINNIEATQVLLEACVGRPLERLVYASSSSVYGDNVAMPMREDALPQPVSPYGVTKLAAEQLCYLYHVELRRADGRRCATSRCTARGSGPTWGSTSSCARRCAGEPITLYGDGEQTRDFTFVADAVARRSRPATAGVPGRVYNIGGGSRVSVNEVLEMIGRVAGRPLDRSRREPAQKGDMRHTYADTRLARAPTSASRPTVDARSRARGRVSNG